MNKKPKSTTLEIQNLIIQSNDLPLYTIAQASRYIGLPSSTLKDWVRGRKYKTSDTTIEVSKLIEPARKIPPTLSFNNLVEAHVLRSLRMKHKIQMPIIRKAIENAQNVLNVDRLLLSEELKTDGKDIFIDQLSETINLSKSNQIVLKGFLDSHLERIEYKDEIPHILYPFTPNSASSNKVILINPQISYGEPVTINNHISTDVLAERVDSGEDIADIAKDYQIGEEEVKEAIFYARAA